MNNEHIKHRGLVAMSLIMPGIGSVIFYPRAAQDNLDTDSTENALEFKMMKRKMTNNTF